MQLVVLKFSSLLWYRCTLPVLILCRIYLSALLVLSIIIAQVLFPPAYVLLATVIVHRLTNKAKNGTRSHCWARIQTCLLNFAFELLQDEYFSYPPYYGALYSSHEKLYWKLPGIPKIFVGYMALYKFLWLLLTRGDFNRFWVVEGDYSCGCVLDTRTSMSFLGNRNISVALFQKNYKKFLKGIPHYFLTMPLFSVISSKFSCIFCARLWCSVLPVSTGHVVSSSMVYCRVSSSEVKCTYFFGYPTLERLQTSV